MSLLNLMYEKRLVKRRAEGRAFIYQTCVSREKTLGQMIGDLCRRAFSNSASSLVEHMLDQTAPSREELRAIREAIDAYQKEHSP
jgi:predicted transcriptional regulator